MRDAVLCKTPKMFGDRLARHGKDERSAAKHGTEKNLQTAVTADIIESAPHRRAVRWTAVANGHREAGKIVRDHFRRPGGARGHQHPFGANRSGECFRHRDDRRRAGGTNRER